MRTTSLPAARRAGIVLIAAYLASAAAVRGGSLEVFSVDPPFRPINTSGTTITIKGVGFRATTTVAFGATPSPSPTLVDSRTIVATVPSAASAQVVTITVSDPTGGTDTFAPFFYTGPVFYVATTGSDANAGTNPLLPKRTLASAFAAVTSGTPTEVRVAAGRYPENSLPLPVGAVLACGWAPGFASRDPDTHITEVDGTGSGWILRTTGISSDSAVDGCTLKNGLRDGFGGGAMPITADSVVINNNVLAGNVATVWGGALYWTATTVYGGRTTVSNNVIVGNRAHGRGGGGVAVYTDDNNQQQLRVTFENNYIVGNRSYRGQGGGVEIASSGYGGYSVARIQAADNIVAFNSALSGGGLDLVMMNFGDHLWLTADNNLLVSNHGEGAGGGLSIQGLGLVTGRVTGATVAANFAGFGEGGGFLIADSINPQSTIAASDLILWGNFGGDALAQAVLRTTYSNSGTPLPGAGNISSDPAFTYGPLGGYYLRQGDPNGPDSPSVDAGSAKAGDLSFEGLTTRTDLAADAGMADMGFHYPRTGTPSPASIQVTRIDPASGDLEGGDWVLIRGRGFDPGAVASFDGIPAERMMYVGWTRLLAQPARHPAGTVNVRVTNPDSSFAQMNGAYTYLDNQPPLWTSTVGVVSAQTAVDCVRSVNLDWNEAVDAHSPPAIYDVYRQACATSSDVSIPCANFGFIPAAADRIATTPDTFYVDLNHPSAGGDPRYIYNVRARDSAAPVSNREYNLGKRVSYATKITTDNVPPSPVGETLRFQTHTLLDWDGSGGSVAYGVYRTTSAAAYMDPNSLAKLVLLNAANNDLNGDGITDTQYDEAALPAGGQIFFYKITAIDPCSVETISELLP
jgi:hypothetical protein